MGGPGASIVVRVQFTEVVQWFVDRSSVGEIAVDQLVKELRARLDAGAALREPGNDK